VCNVPLGNLSLPQALLHARIVQVVTAAIQELQHVFCVLRGTQDRTAVRAPLARLANTRVLLEQQPALIVRLLHGPFQVVPHDSWTATAMPGSQAIKVVRVQSVQLERIKALEVLRVGPVTQERLHHQGLQT